MTALNFSDLIKVTFLNSERPSIDYFIHPSSGETLVRGCDLFKGLELDMSNIKQFPRKEKIMVREGKKAVIFLGEAGHLTAVKMALARINSMPCCSEDAVPSTL
jgi:hypothetical protein